jgi:hypothetical protein
MSPLKQITNKFDTSIQDIWLLLGGAEAGISLSKLYYLGAGTTTLSKNSKIAKGIDAVLKNPPNTFYNQHRAFMEQRVGETQERLRDKINRVS